MGDLVDSNAPRGNGARIFSAKKIFFGRLTQSVELTSMLDHGMTSKKGHPLEN